MARQKLSTQEQQQLREQFQADYQIEIERFDEETGEPSFSFDQLQRLLFCLCDDLAANEVEPGFTDLDTGEVTARTIFTLKTGLRVTRTGKARIGQTLRTGETIADEAQAIGLAKLNSFRDALRAIGFNPLAIHRALHAGEPQPELNQTGEGDLETKRRELHALAEEAGMIRTDAKGTKDMVDYRRFLLARFGVNTSSKLNAEQLALAVQYLRSDLQITYYQQRAAA